MVEQNCFYVFPIRIKKINFIFHIYTGVSKGAKPLYALRWVQGGALDVERPMPLAMDAGFGVLVDFDSRNS